MTRPLMVDASLDPSRSSNLQQELRAALHVLLRDAWIIALAAGLAVGIGFLVIARSERIFRSSSTIEVDPDQQRLTPSPNRPAEPRAEETLKTIEQNLTNPALLLRLARHPDLTRDPEFLRSVPAGTSDARTEQIVSGKISVKVRPGTRLIDIDAEDSSPAVARKLADLLVAEFLTSTAEGRSQSTRLAHEDLRKEAEHLQAVLAKSEETLQRYKEQTRAVSLEEKQNIVVERLRELNTRVTAAKTERLKLEADQTQLQGLAGQPPSQWLVLPSVASAPEVVLLQGRIATAENELSTIALRYKSLHPRHITATNNLRELQAQLDETVRKAAARIATGLEVAKANEAKLEEALKSQEALALDLSNSAIPYQTLSREVEANRALYSSVLARLKETDVGQGVAPYSIRVVSPALLAERPIKPRKSLILLLSLFGGATVGGTFVLGRHAFDSTVRTVDQAERLFSLPVLGAIPQGRRLASREAPRDLATRRGSAVTEAFHDLRTTLLVSGKASPQVVLLSSAVPGEGKTFCAVNLAVAFAQQGLRTLLIDADLRLPSVARTLFGGEQPRGLSEILTGTGAPDEVIFRTEIENLEVLPGGPPLRNPSETVGRAPIGQLLGELRRSYERIVIDTAPVHAVSDTVFFTPHVDAICMVIHSGRTPAAVAARALEKVRQSGARIAGVILNRLPRKGGNYYHYQAGGYGGDEVYGDRRTRSGR